MDHWLSSSHQEEDVEEERWLTGRLPASKWRTRRRDESPFVFMRATRGEGEEVAHRSSSCHQEKDVRKRTGSLLVLVRASRGGGEGEITHRSSSREQ